MTDDPKDDEILDGANENRDAENQDINETPENTANDAADEESAAEEDAEDAVEADPEHAPTQLPADPNAPAWDSEAVKKSHLHGMFRTWFLDYASYVILDRAVPYIEDGLKPVQRRILHTMYRMEDGRYNKVANIVGATMSFHPHGDASIYGALVSLGQKDLTVDHQGNWGNILTGDSAAAARYIEARLTKFAQEVVFDPKITTWMESYDGRNQEPVTLPVRFPLLLAQGGEGIGVGLASVILPHNFNELIDASIAHLEGKPFELYPDFPTGGMIDVSRYNDGIRGGKVRVRAKIEKRDARTLAITEIPFSVTTNDLMDSIQKVAGKKIQIKKIDDNTAAKAEIIITLPSGASPDKTIDALYAFTKCEDSISPNACVIVERKPMFMGVSEILRYSTNRTVDLLRQQLQIRMGELQKQWHMLSLEKIFIEERIYKDREFEESGSNDEACAHIDKRIRAYIAANYSNPDDTDDVILAENGRLLNQITKEDLLHLLDIKMARILRFNSQAAEDKLIAMQAEMKKVADNIEHIVAYTIAYFKRIKKQFGAGRDRQTEIRSFDNIVASKVAERNKKLFVDREDGFIGYGLKKGDFVSECSDIDDVIIFYESGRYVVKKIGEKVDVGTGVTHVAVFKKNDSRTVYNAIYTDGETGITYAKRFSVTGVTRDRDYEITTATKGTKMRYFSANANGEAEVVKVFLRPRAKMHNVTFEFDFASLAVKGRGSRGNIVTKYEVYKMKRARDGESTLGGRKVWFEPETLRLNPDGRGELLGEFSGDDRILLITKEGQAQTIGIEFEQHFEDNILRIEKFDPHKTWTAIYIDGETKLHYIKRFKLAVSNKPIDLIGDNPKSKLVLLSDEDHPLFLVKFGGDDKWRPEEKIDAFEFIGEKGVKAKGKRLAAYPVGKVTELEPVIPTVRQTDAPADDEKTDDSPEEDEPTGEEPNLFS